VVEINQHHLEEEKTMNKYCLLIDVSLGYLIINRNEHVAGFDVVVNYVILVADV